MTYSAPPPPPPAAGWGPPPGPPPGSQPGPAPATKPAASLVPIVVVTVLFSLFGLIPTIMASSRAADRRESAARYWVAFVVSLLASFVLYLAIFLVLAYVVLRSAFGFVDEVVSSIPTPPSTFPTATTTGTGTTAPAGTCTYTPDGSSSTVALPDPDPSGVTATTWTLVTTAGTIVVDLDAAAAPCTVNSIVHLTQLGFYDGSSCPRSVSGSLSLLQCGDPTGTGAGGPGYTFADEDLGDADYGPGSVAMANRGPDTNGSQFFVSDSDRNSQLPASYTVFGTVTQGLDVVSTVIAAGNDGANGEGDGRPTSPVSIVTATVS